MAAARVQRATNADGGPDETGGARALDSGSFMPTLVVSKHLWPSRPRTIAVASEGCRNVDEAIASAHAQGLAWVRDYG